MNKSYDFDAVVVGSGPNGLAAAITLAQAGLSVMIFEAKETIGGGMRSAELTLPGFTHDICSAVHPLGIASPFLRTLPLHKYGLEWIHPLFPLSHPFDDNTAATLDRSIEKTSDTLGEDSIAYKNLIQPLSYEWNNIATDLLGPLRFPKHPITMAQFGFLGVRSADSLVKSFFQGIKARGLFAGLAAHSIMPLTKPLTAAFALILDILGHVAGWPFARGGSQKIADALASYFLSLGGKIITNKNITSMNDLPSSRFVFFDVTPRQLLHIAGDRLPVTYKKKLENYRYGPGVFKVDWALNHPIPWKAKECSGAGTVHIGGTLEEITRSENEVWIGQHPEKPFVLIAQPSLFDATRAPEGKHTAWGYCHVPNGSTLNMLQRIESQIERFAPGFRDCILARNTMSTAELEQYNANYIGGDINGGVQDIYQLFTRPTARLVPYSTPIKGVYICSSSTPPGGGVHGMCGYHAARAALKTDE